MVTFFDINDIFTKIQIQKQNNTKIESEYILIGSHML